MTARADTVPSPAEVVVKVARAFEHDRYLAALLAPRAARDALIAIAALAGEIGRIPSAVSDPMIGEIRLQWWRDAFKAALDAPSREAPGSSGHPIADAVIDAARRHSLPLSELLALIEAQSERLDDQPFATQEAVVANVRRWDGGLFRLAWRILEPQSAGLERPSGDVLPHAGSLYGIARILIDVPIDLSHGRTLLPASDATVAKATAEPAQHGKAIDHLDAARQQLADWVARTLPDVARRYQEADRSVRIAALPVALVQPYLALSRRTRLQSATAADIAPLSRVWRLWRSARSGRVQGRA